MGACLWFGRLCPQKPSGIAFLPGPSGMWPVHDAGLRACSPARGLKGPTAGLGRAGAGSRTGVLFSSGDRSPSVTPQVRRTREGKSEAEHVRDSHSPLVVLRGASSCPVTLLGERRGTPVAPACLAQPAGGTRWRTHGRAARWRLSAGADSRPGRVTSATESHSGGALSAQRSSSPAANERGRPLPAARWNAPGVGPQPAFGPRDAAAVEAPRRAPERATTCS